jgi:hypothetical protein
MDAIVYMVGDRHLHLSVLTWWEAGTSTCRYWLRTIIRWPRQRCSRSISWLRWTLLDPTHTSRASGRTRRRHAEDRRRRKEQTLTISTSAHEWRSSSAMVWDGVSQPGERLKEKRFTRAEGATPARDTKNITNTKEGASSPHPRYMTPILSLSDREMWLGQ